MSREDYDALCVLVRETFDGLDYPPDRLRAASNAAADLLGVRHVDPHTLAAILRRGRELKEPRHVAA